MSKESIVLRRALMDAIEWRLSFAAANHEGPERDGSLALVAKYRALLKKRYGDDRLPHEIAFEGARSVSIFDMK